MERWAHKFYSSNLLVWEITFKMIKGFHLKGCYHSGAQNKLLAGLGQTLASLEVYWTHAVPSWNYLLSQVYMVDIYELKSVTGLTQGLEPSSRKRLVGWSMVTPTENMLMTFTYCNSNMINENTNSKIYGERKPLSHLTS